MANLIPQPWTFYGGLWHQKPEGSITPVTALGGVDFDGLTSGQSVTGIVDFYGTYGNGYGMQGDTSVKRAGKTSSASCSIQSGTTGRPGDGTPAGNGDFGFIQSLVDRGHQVTEGQEIWLYGWLYVPSDFNFNTGATGLKFIRFSYPSAGPELDTYIANGQSIGGGDSTACEGFHLVNESFPQLQANTNRRTGPRIAKGQWNFFCQYVKASVNQADSIERLWINDAFTMEHVGGAVQVTTKWVDENSSLQTAAWTPSGGRYSTLADTDAEISSFYLFTYWNNNSPQDQQLNIDQIKYVKADTNLETDAYGNKYVSSGQVA